MNVHHSRDTFTKQWVETLEKALRGWTAYLKVMLIHVMHLPCFKEDWLTLVRVLKSLITMEHLPDDPRTRKVSAHNACEVTNNTCSPCARRGVLCALVDSCALVNRWAARSGTQIQIIFFGILEFARWG